MSTTKRLDELKYAELLPVLAIIKKAEQEAKEVSGVCVRLLYYDANTISNKTQPVTANIEKIIHTTKYCIEILFGITAAQLEGKSKATEIVECRQFFSQVMKLKTGISQESIGLHLGGIDHASIINQLRKFSDYYDTRPEYRNRFFKLLSHVDEALKSVDIAPRQEALEERARLEEEIRQLGERQNAPNLKPGDRAAIVNQKQEKKKRLEVINKMHFNNEQEP